MGLREVATIAVSAILCCSNGRCYVSAFAFTSPLRSPSFQRQSPISTLRTQLHQQPQPQPQQLRVLGTTGRCKHVTGAVAARGMSMAQETLILTEENVITVLAEAKRELSTLFGNNAENTAVGITGDCEFVCLDGPSVVVRLTGRFWHEKAVVLARVANFVQTRIPECVDVEIEDPAQLEDADPQGRGHGGEL